MGSGEAPETATGFLSCAGEDGRLRFGAAALRGRQWRLDTDGIFEEVPEDERAGGLAAPAKEYRWEELRQVSLRLRPTISPRLLFTPLRDFEYRLELHTADDAGHVKGWYMYQHHVLARTDRRMHARALPALMQFLIATPDARPGLGDPAAVSALLDELGECLGTTVAAAGRRARWPSGTYASRRELDAAAISVLAERGVVLFAGRPLRGRRLDASPEVIADVEADYAAHCRAAAAPADVVAAAVDAVQGPHPDWPFDVLLPRR